MLTVAKHVLNHHEWTSKNVPPPVRSGGKYPPPPPAKSLPTLYSPHLFISAYLSLCISFTLSLCISFSPISFSLSPCLPFSPIFFSLSLFSLHIFLSKYFSFICIVFARYHNLSFFFLPLFLFSPHTCL